MRISIDPHPLLDLQAFVTTYDAPPAHDAAIFAKLATDAPAPIASSDEVRAAVRDLLRHGGYKPTGRGKPASEYLLRAVGENALASINAAVDACNVASFHSGLPISVVDLDKTKEPLRVAIPEAGASYVFNASGQTIDVTGLLCLCDADGPCANAVKDAQRTKTGPTTLRTLSVIWGTKALPGHAEKTARFYRELVTSSGGHLSDVALD